MTRLFVLLWLLIAATPALAQTFPPLSGRVVDQADLLDPGQEVSIAVKLEALETSSGRQFVVATVASLEDRPIEDYGYQLGRAWGIGTAAKNDGAILLIAPNERKVRVEVGYGLEPVLTDALSSTIIRNSILPRFKAGDMAGGIMAGVDAILPQLSLPPEEAAARQQQMIASEPRRSGGGSGGIPFSGIIWLIVIAIFVLPMILGRRRGGRGGRRYRGGTGPIILWGGGDSWGGGGSSWGGGGGGFSGGGFSGGGGSFGGGGASGDW